LTLRGFTRPLEGDTLVIDTSNFIGVDDFYGADENLHLTERLTRVDRDTILYRFAVDDPTAFTRPRSGKIPMTNSQLEIFDYECHEGNYAWVDILAGVRAQERAAEQTATTGREGAAIVAASGPQPVNLGNDFLIRLLVSARTKKKNPADLAYESGEAVTVSPIVGLASDFRCSTVHIMPTRGMKRDIWSGSANTAS
jgi:hypothetical protein